MSADFSRFDLERTPLANGVTLIEASAGTGKTHTIAGLVLRLILERGLGIEQILVTTFTELATAELRDRVRARLRDALTATDASTDAKARLELALRNFDEAPIYTIHGFCQRLLHDRAFESGTLFNAELVQDDSVLLRELADDFWRAHFYDASEAVTIAASRGGLDPGDLLTRLGPLKSNPDALILPSVSGGELAETIARLERQWRALREGWAEWAAEVAEIFREAKWANRPYNHPETMTAHLADLAACLTGQAGDDLSCLALFAKSSLAEKVSQRAKLEPPEHALFEHCEDFVAATEDFAAIVRATFCQWARDELVRRRKERNVLSFDDLLLRLREALRGPHGAALADAVRTKFPAAMLDEFQDTDPVQEEIFRRIYAGSAAPVYLIGDPKQAIYSFRGADVYSYLSAARGAAARFTLQENWRSVTALVESVNSLFEAREDAFVVENIIFRPVRGAGQPDDKPLRRNGEAEPPFRLWMVEEEAELTNGEAKPLIAARTAGEIARLLAEPAHIGERPLRPSDIAVLVASRYEARDMQAALSARGVPSVFSGAANVFQSEEAAELRQLLAALVEPGRESLVRGALATTLLGFDATELDAIAHDEHRWNEIIELFAGGHERWRDHGFMPMFRFFLRAQGERERLLRLPDGERRLTNLLHLAELIHQASLSRQLGINGTMKWFVTQMQNPEGGREEEFELRLERDDEAVRLLTIHKSKGLEFEVVFCPFLWVGGRGSRQSGYHGEDGRLVLPMGEASEAEIAQAEREGLAEQVRLLYVALTRAKRRCVAVWGALKNRKGSGLEHVLNDRAPRDLLHGAAIEPMPGEDAPLYLPSASQTAPRQARAFTGNIDRSWGVSSFTGLSRDRITEPMIAELPEDEPEVEPAEPLPEAMGMAAFPRGAKPGTCLHEILQNIDFTDPASIAPVVKSKLRAFSIHGQNEVVHSAIRRTLDVPLAPGLTLAGVPESARLHEMEFHFPVTQLTAAKLNSGWGQGWNLAFPPLNGFLKGFIDLVFEHEGKFFIVDWKSNWLGLDESAYPPAALEAEMTRRGYGLQLHLYAVALDRYLRWRQPGYDYERHFGGVFYVFLRGIDPARPELGIYRKKPPRARLAALNSLFEGGLL